MKDSSSETLLEFFLLLIVATLFLLNGLIIISSCLSVWAPLFALMVLFNLLSSWSWDWTLSLSRVAIHLLQYFYLNIFIIKAWKYIEETGPKHRWNKIYFYQIIFDFFYLSKTLVCASWNTVRVSGKQLN